MPANPLRRTTSAAATSTVIFLVTACSGAGTDPVTVASSTSASPAGTTTVAPTAAPTAAPTGLDPAAAAPASAPASTITTAGLTASAQPLSLRFGSQYHLTFNDEFNAYVPSRWQTSDYWGMRNNGGDFQAQWFTDPVSVPGGSTKVAYNPFSTSNGVLTITARPTPPNTYAGPDDLPYVSGQLTTAHRFTQRYGYYELRAKLPPGKGLWSRFWLLTDDGVWPGEYDVFEVLGKETGKVRQNTHYFTATSPHLGEGGTYTGINPVDGQFHTYGFLWEPTGVNWYVDGVLAATQTQINRIDIPMYTLIDLAVGNDPNNWWPGNPDGATPWPAKMEVDYFRVYSNDPSLPAVVPDAGYTPSRLPKGYTVVDGPAVGPLPPGWTIGDVGSPDLAGTSTWNPNTGEWILKGAGTGSQTQFAATQIAGDGVITAKLASATKINYNEVRAGVAMRASRDISAREIALVHLTNYYVRPSGTTLTRRVVLQARGGGQPSVELATSGEIAAPVALRLARQGNVFTGTYSTDGGVTWTTLGSTTNAQMAGPLLAGMVVNGNADGYRKWSRGIFSSATVTGN